MSVGHSSSQLERAMVLRVLGFACIACMGNVAFGYDVGVVSGSLADMASSLELSTLQKQAATAGLNFVAGFGAVLISGNVLDRFGRKVALLLASCFMLVGAALCCTATNFAWLLLGRMCQGLGSGASWCAVSVYITEVAPTRYRGALVAVADIAINVGILLGYAMDFLVQSLTSTPSQHWRSSMLLSVVWPLLFCLCYRWLPETPRWLVMHGRNTEALKVLCHLEGIPNIESDSSIEANAGLDCTSEAGHLVAVENTSLEGISEADYLVAAVGEGISEAGRGGEHITHEAGTLSAEDRRNKVLDTLRAIEAAQLAHRADVSWGEALLPKGAQRKRMVVVALFLGLAQQLTGTEAILYYAPTLLSSLSPIEVFVANLGVGTCKLGGELVAASLTDHASFGRRPLLTWSNLALSLCVLGIALSLQWGVSLTWTILLLCATMLTFSLGAGPLTFVVVNEMLPQRERARVVAASCLVNRLTSGSVALTFLSLSDSLGSSGAFFLYAGLGCLCSLFYAVCIPETSGMSLEEDTDSGANRGERPLTQPLI